MPTCLRGRGVAMVNLMSMLAMVAAPYIVYSVGHGNLYIFSRESDSTTTNVRSSVHPFVSLSESKTPKQL